MNNRKSAPRKTRKASTQQCARCRTHLERGDYAKAYQGYKTLVENYQPDETVWDGVACAAWGLGRLEEALHGFQQSCRLNPLNPAHWSNIGLALRDLKRPERAINAFRIALMIKPDFAGAYNEWGNVLIDMNRPHEAQYYYQKALRIDDTRAVYHHNYGICCKMRGDKQAARDCFSKALEIDPHYDHSLEELGLLLLEANDPAGARLLNTANTARAQWLLQEYAHVVAH